MTSRPASDGPASAPGLATKQCSICGSGERPHEIVPCAVCDAAFHLGPGGVSDCGDVVTGKNCCGVVVRCGRCRELGAGV